MVLVQLTNGFGNNMFQYNAARLLAEYLEQEIYAIPPFRDYYAISCLNSLGIKFLPPTISVNECIEIDERNYRSAFDKKYRDHNFVVRGYFEDYSLFTDDLRRIRSWYPEIKKRSDSDLVIHFRAGDRLLYKNEFYQKPSVESYINAIESFNFDSLHVVTDMPKWDYISEDDVENMRFHVDVPIENRVPSAESSDYFNSFVKAFEKYEPVFEKRDVCEDFQFIRSFDNILFQHGTLGWWAAMLSEASRVGVYGPWRPWKGASNKNLSATPLDNWFKWE